MYTSNASLNTLADRFMEDLSDVRFDYKESVVEGLKSEAEEMRIKYPSLFKSWDWRDILNDPSMYDFQKFDSTVPNEVKYTELDFLINQFAENITTSKFDYELDLDPDVEYEKYVESVLDEQPY